MKEVILVGLNYRTAPVETREKIAFPEEDLEHYLKALKGLSSITEGLILSTCNRVEIYAATEIPEEGIKDIKGFLSVQHRLPLPSFEDTLYVLTGTELVRHCFRVASSLDSMVVGEPQILGQIKEAYRIAHAAKATGTLLNKLLPRSFSVAKRVRTETGIGNGAVSVSFIAVELAKRIFEHLEGREVLIIGAGDMCELAVQHLVREGVNRISVSNRTWERAVMLAEQFKGEAIPFSELGRALLQTDIVITSTDAPNFVVSRDMVVDILKQRKNRPLFFIDIAVPRDIDPQVNSIDNVYLYDIDDLQEVAVANIKGRQQEALRAEGIVAAAVEQFCRWYQSLEVIPTIVALKEKMERIRKKEVDKMLVSLPDLSARQRQAMEDLSKTIVNKILHNPIVLLKRADENADGEPYVDVVKKLFSVDTE
jgi:glutamyl-tRNA reductase